MLRLQLVTVVCVLTVIVDVEAICTMPTSIPGNAIQLYHGDKLHLFCQRGYHLYPNTKFITCRGNGFWDPSVPKCYPLDYPRTREMIPSFTRVVQNNMLTMSDVLLLWILIQKMKKNEGGCRKKSEECVFPFTYLTQEYNECTMDGHDQPWCYTRNIGDVGLFQSDWVNCGECIEERCVNDQNENQCKFPFTYDGTVYYDCTEADHDQRWCYTNSARTRWVNCYYCEDGEPFNPITTK